MPRHRSTASFGRRMEFVAMAELLKRHYDVYLTLVDDQQIDCVLRFDTQPPRYVDVQIKARSKDAKHGGTFASLEIRKPRPDYFFIFYSEAAEHFWIMPSLDVVKFGSVGKSGKGKGQYRLDFTSRRAKGRPRPKWNDYLDKFELLGPPIPQPPKAA